MWAMMEKLRMFFINKLKTKKSGTRPAGMGDVVIVGRRNTKKAPRLGDGKFPGRAPYRARCGAQAPGIHP
jgi:hypothetical protein